MELGGQAGHRLTMRLAMPASGSTLLRLVRRYRRSDPPQAHVAVGIDDWALRRGKQYGSILVDLERHRPIGLLASRASPEVMAWLSSMRSPQIVTRDRSTDYQRAVSQVWPNAKQVADRWHLLKNLHEAVERVFTSHPREVRHAVAGLSAGHLSRYAQSRWLSTTDEARRHTAAKRRQSRHDRVHRLRAAGLTIRQIAKRLRIRHTTVCSDLQRKTPVGPIFLGRSASILDPYIDHIDKRWTEGCNNASQLHRETRSMGYLGSRKPVSKWVALRRTQPARTSPTQQLPVADSNPNAPTPRHLAWLLLQPWIDLNHADQHLVESLLKQDVFKHCQTLALEFKQAAVQAKSLKQFTRCRRRNKPNRVL